MSETRSTVQAPAGQAVPRPRVGTDAVPEAAPAPAPAAVGDPGMIGLPAFLVGSVALALVDIGFAPLAAAGAAVPIIVSATWLGLLIAAVWAARLGQNAVASIYGVFAGFWLSFGALSLGLGHNWFAVLPAGVARTMEVFLIAWIVVVGLLTVGTLRLPVAFTALLALVELALVLTLLATVNASTGLTKTAGWVVVGFSAIGAYLYLSALSTATGGRAYPVGRPLIK